MAYTFVKLFQKIQFQRNIMTTAFNAEKVMEQLQQNPYYKKYADKIASLQQTSPQEFLNRIEAKVQNEKALKENQKLKERQYSSVLNPKPDITSNKSGTEIKNLNDIMKIDLIRDKSADEIRDIWHKYHMTKDTIAAVITKHQYELIDSRVRKYPIFLFPLPRSQGYEFIMCQCSGNQAHFTPLLCYQVHNENAPECLTIVNYLELKDEKEIILMRGEFDKNVLDAKEAQCLANQFQMYYGHRDDDDSSVSRLDLLETFTKRPDEFKHMDLIKQLENLSIV